MKALSTIFAVVFVATTVVLPTSTPTEALHHLENRATCTSAVTDNLIFAVSIGSFEKSRNAKDPSCCNIAPGLPISPTASTSSPVATVTISVTATPKPKSASQAI
ncbi:hypothetical protein E5D57_001711 [Metarhizium anisopliae]|nr:hypothetical protein E5D57_001711 [Metarhizium anisopliae]